MADDHIQQQQLAALVGTEAEVVGQRLSLKIGKVNCPGIVIAYFPKTQKHRIRLLGTDGSTREKNFRLQDVDHKLIEDHEHDDKTTTVPPPSLDLAIRRDAVGRRLEIYHQVRQKWYKGTILRYVEHCQQHAIILEPQGKVHLVDLSEQAWRFTDLIAGETASSSSSSAEPHKEPLKATDTPSSPVPPQQTTSSLATSKYMGVQRYTESTWKAYYYVVTDGDNTASDDDNKLYIGCFGTEKDAALAYDVYARKRGTPVNFGDRRICKRGIKLLIVPEPPEPEPVAHQTVVLPESTTSNHLEPPETSAISPASATTTTGATPALESTASSVDLTTATVAPTVTADIDTPPLLTEEKTDAMDIATTTAPATVEEEEEDNNNHTMVDMTEADIVPEPPSVPHRRISVNDDDDEDESVVCTKKQQKKRKKSSSPAASTTKTTTTKKPVNAVEEDSDESEFEFDGEEDNEESEEESSSEDSEMSGSSDESENDSDESDVEESPPPPKPKQQQQQPRIKQLGKKRTKPAPATANLFDSSEDEEEEEERMIARKLKRKGRARALRELEDFNVPPRSKNNKQNKKTGNNNNNNNKSTTSNPQKRKRGRPRKGPKYPVGTRFLKDFPDHGVFEGCITEWDGKYYQVFYPEDEDRETLAEEDFDDFEILSIPKKKGSSTGIDAGKKKKKKRRKQAYIE